jgi:hypothetical protein
MKYLKQEDFEIDILRSMFNLWNKYSLIALESGHGQSGKTTNIFYNANRLMQLKKYGYKALDPNAPCNTWHEWDAYNLTATNAQDFVRIWNNNENAILTLAESSTTLYYMDWMQVMGRVFNSTTTTQGLKHNICFLDTVMETELMQKARDKIDYRIEVHKRIDELRYAEIRSGWVLIDYLDMKWMLIRNNKWDLVYPMKFLVIAKQYTDWIAETMKKREAELNEQRVGLKPYIEKYNPTKPISNRNMPDWVRNLL